jgi:coenzyme F420 hydrogenase subunit beta
MAASEDEILQYKWLGRELGFTALEHEVVFKDLCCGCGACAAVCPEDVITVDEFPKLVGECTDCGFCLSQCPRSYFDSSAIEEKMYGSIAEDPIGRITMIKGVKAKDVEMQKQAQDGGFVTTLLKYSLNKGIIDGALVTDSDENWKPVPKLITSSRELAGTSGTRYSNCANLSPLSEAKKKGLKKLALVGLPCQIEGIRKIQYYPIEDIDLKDRIVFTIALFCKSNFLYDGLMQGVIKDRYGVDLKKMRKIDIKGKSVIVTTDRGNIEIPLAEAHEYEREGCKVCWDFTSRLSDFSAGSVGTPAGYTTVIARNKMASELLIKMEKDDIIETIDVEGREPLKLQAAKEKRAIKDTRRRIRKVLPLPFKHLKF